MQVPQQQASSATLAVHPRSNLPKKGSWSTAGSAGWQEMMFVNGGDEQLPRFEFTEPGWGFERRNYFVE